MNNKFKNKYRIQSTRLQNWDYGWNGLYFITICTKNRKCFFGDIVNGKINLSQIGIIADILWYEIKNHAQNIELDEFTVMPNHIHGILILNGNDNRNENENENENENVETRHALSLQSQFQSKNTIGQKRFQNQGKNTVSSIIGGYKSAVTKHAHRLGFEFAWQRNYWEHIIRNKTEYNRIAQYIINNPVIWKNDKLNGGTGNIVI
jgi:putative transposase